MAMRALKILTSADLLGCKKIQWAWQHSIYTSTKAHNKQNLMSTGHHELYRTLKTRILHMNIHSLIYSVYI